MKGLSPVKFAQLLNAAVSALGYRRVIKTLKADPTSQRIEA
jgi:hypothetical protein